MVKVAVAQVAPVFLDKERTVQKAESLIAEIARNGAELVVFPETWIPTYPIWSGTAAFWDDPDAKRAFAQLQAESVEIPGPETERLAAAAAAAGVTVVIGANERDARYARGTLYNTLMTFSADGGLVNAHRKLVPTHGERLFWGQGDGSDIAVHDASFGRLGTAICWEHWMPLYRFALHTLAEQIHVGVFPDMPAYHGLAAKSYAFEGRCFFVGAGTYLEASAVPKDFPFRQFLDRFEDEVLLGGGSAIAGPDGEWVVEPVYGREEILYGDLDLTRIAEEQYALEVVGHYNRPDIFDLRINDAPKPPVRWGGGTA